MNSVLDGFSGPGHSHVFGLRIHPEALLLPKAA